jgi:Activator of Hsp90 ATPase homolog 1-like protein
MGKENETPAPIRQSVHVDCSIEETFRLFTEGFGEWWPLPSCAEGEKAGHIDIEPWRGGKVSERTRSGKEHEWGTVIAWDPPDRVEFTWHPGRPDDSDQTVTVDFRVEADGTRVTLTHYGWQWAGVATCASRFATFVAGQMLVGV